MPILKLIARSVKCTIVTTSEQIAGFDASPGLGPVPFVVNVDGRTIIGRFNPRSLRRAIAAAATPGISNIIIQGTLTEDDVLEDAGISVP